MSADKLRKHLQTKKPLTIDSAYSMGKIYGVTTQTAVRILQQAGYEKSADNTGWHLTNRPTTITQIEVPVSKPGPFSITEATLVALKELPATSFELLTTYISQSSKLNFQNRITAKERVDLARSIIWIGMTILAKEGDEGELKPCVLTQTENSLIPLHLKQQGTD